MKKLLLFLLIILTNPIHSQSWIAQNSGVATDLNDVYCISGSHVIVVGNTGTILKTIDGGENWIPKTSGTSSDLMKVQFINATTGYAFGTNATLIKTTDGGENWISIDTGSTTPINDLSCVSENVFYITTGGWLKKTINGGVSFETINTAQSGQKIQFINEQKGFASSDTHLYKTTDGGMTWLVIKEDTIHSFFFVNENTGFVYTAGNGNYKTVDEGLNYSAIGYSPALAQDLFSLDGSVVWEVNGLFELCGCPPEYCISKRSIAVNNESDEISNCNLSGNPDFKLNAIHFANATTGFAVGATGHMNPMNPNGPVGAIYKNPTGAMEPMSVDSRDKNDIVRLYPNPASDKITISFSDNPSQHFSIEITDFLGKKVLVQKNIETVDLSNFPAGVYLARIVSVNGISIQKFIKK